jgi:hypothetical protein
MRAFQDYEIGWDGKSYVIPSDRLLPVIAAIEEDITVPQLLMMTVVRRMPVARISRAYGTILRAAGVKGSDGGALITDAEVYAGMFDGEGVLEKAALAVQGLMSLIIPPDDMQSDLAAQGGAAAPGKPAPASRRSKGSTRRLSARAG